MPATKGCHLRTRRWQYRPVSDKRGVVEKERAFEFGFGSLPEILPQIQALGPVWGWPGLRGRWGNIAIEDNIGGGTISAPTEKDR